MLTVADPEHVGNRLARARVIDYYDNCWDDYRILWRTDENGSVHFGFFDPATVTVGDRLHRIGDACVGLGAAVIAGGAALLSRTDAALRWLHVAARGRATRHDVAQRRMTAECANAVGLRPGMLVLDAGCGVGGTDLWLADTHRVRVHGVNIQPLHLGYASRNASHHPAGSAVRFSRQDFTELAIASSSVDVVWGLESVCHCQDKSAFVREAFRVLRRGGRLMVADFFRTDANGSHGAESMRIWTDGWALPNLASVAGFTDVLGVSGFSDVACRDIRANVMPSSRRLYKASLVARPINALLEAVGVRSPIAGANVRAAFHQYVTLRDGDWTYAIFTATKR
jgi:SAM-dependent methyltransferase